jgi:hypothetical protein
LRETHPIPKHQQKTKRKESGTKTKNPATMVAKRQRSARVFFDPSASAKTTYVDQLKNESQRLIGAARIQRPTKRQRTTRDFFDPCVRASTTYVDKMMEESKKVVMNIDIVPRLDIIKLPKSDAFETLIRKESYNKDDTGEMYCGIKKLINTFISSHAKKHHKCLVLDAAKARTTKELLKVGVSRVDIPNDSETYHDLVKFSKRAGNDGIVKVHPMSLNKFLEVSNNTFDIVYMDTCGTYENSPGRDVKTCLEALSNGNASLSDDPLLGVTITFRCPQGKKSWKSCEEHIRNAFGLQKCWEIQYGMMKTMFFNKK